MTRPSKGQIGWGIVVVAMVLASLFFGVKMPIPPAPEPTPVVEPEQPAAMVSDAFYQSLIVDKELTSNGTSAFNGAVQFNGSVTGGAVTNDLNGGPFILDPTGNTILRAQVDDTVTLTSASATGTWGVKTGNLTVGAGTPGLALNGQDAYVSDHLEVDGAAQFDGAVTTTSTLAADGGLTVDTSNFTVSGTTGAVASASSMGVGTWVKLGAQTAISVTAGLTIAPTGTYQPLTSAGAKACSTTTCIANGTTAGDLLILRNANASDVITIDGTGGNVECKSDVALGAGDTLSLIWNGADWNCIANHDNS